jgi:glyoxylase-like metal-dependent hydrolase (beta-lactamase superfamily II)
VTSGEFSSNAYLCEAQVEGGGILIDAGSMATIDAELSEHGLSARVYCTHGHFDHTGSASHFRKIRLPGVRAQGRPKLMKASNFLLMAFKLFAWCCRGDTGGSGHVAAMWPARRCAIAGARPHAGFLHRIRQCWFTGDTLYARGVGLSHLPGEDHAVLKQTILGYWQDLTPERTIYPGHGNGPTAVGPYRQRRC